MGAEYFPAQLKIDIRSRLKDKIMDAFSANGTSWVTPDDVKDRIFHGNAERVLGL